MSCRPQRLEEIFRGDTWQGVKVTVVDKDTQLPVDITDVNEIIMQMRADDVQGDLQATRTMSEGHISKQVPNADGVFTLLPFVYDGLAGPIYLDFELQWVDGSITTVAQALLPVCQDVTIPSQTT